MLINGEHRHLDDITLPNTFERLDHFNLGYLPLKCNPIVWHVAKCAPDI